MITDKQRQRDFEYEADYQGKSCYTDEQWTNILKSGQLSEEDISLLMQVYSSFNHAATLPALGFLNKASEEDLLARFNAMGEVLGKANNLEPEVDFDGKEYWWYLCCWGKNIEGGTLELKLHPELSEAIAALAPELEETYYAFMNDVDRSLQIRYTQEDSVWVASAVLLYEKYYQNPGISADDILLMQYEVQTRAQKVFGQDIDVKTITEVCNADAQGHNYNYLRDIYKYYRVAFPGEFDGNRERPDPKDFDYNAYVYSVYGYMPVTRVVDFIEHEYAHLVDESYVELNASNGFVRLADFLTRQGGTVFDAEDSSDEMFALRTNGEDCAATFHKLADALIREYPGFQYARKADWLDGGRTASIFCDVLSMENYAHTHASLSFLTVPDKDAVHIEAALNLPFCASEDAMAAIQEKINNLTLLTAAPFQVENRETEGFDLTEDSQKYKAFVLFSYEDFKTMSEEDIVGMISDATQILASYYTDICQNYYPAKDGADGTATEDPLAAALGSKLTYRPAANTPEPEIKYKQGPVASNADEIARALNGYVTRTEANDAAAGGQSAGTDAAAGQTGFGQGGSGQMRAGQMSAGQMSSGQMNSGQMNAGQAGAGGTGYGQSAAAAAAAGSQAAYSSAAGPAMPSMPFMPSIPPMPPVPQYEPVPVSTHPERSDQSFKLYPKNTLIKGALKTGKYYEAILTAVGIIEGKEPGMIRIEPVPDVLEHYKSYVEEGRIMHISYPDIDCEGYDGWIESTHGPMPRAGIFKEFANRCAGGRYVVLIEEMNTSWDHLFGEASVLLRDNRREGCSSETAVTLLHSKEKFTLPSNLYIVATCDADIGQDSITSALSLDFFIRNIAPNAEALRGELVEGIRLDKLMTTMNTRLAYFLGSDYQLGEGFFLGSADEDPFLSLGRVFREQLIPLLEKWFDGDIERIRYVLGDNGKRRQETVFYREMPFKKGMFKGEIPDSFDQGRCVYEINEDAFFTPKSYITLYE